MSTPTCGMTRCADAAEGSKKRSVTTAPAIKTLGLGICLKFNLDGRYTMPASTKSLLGSKQATNRTIITKQPLP